MNKNYYLARGRCSPKTLRAHHNRTIRNEENIEIFQLCELFQPIKARFTSRISNLCYDKKITRCSLKEFEREISVFVFGILDGVIVRLVHERENYGEARHKNFPLCLASS